MEGSKARTAVPSAKAVTDAEAMEARMRVLETVVAGLRQDVSELTAEVERLSAVVIDTRHVGETNLQNVNDEVSGLRGAVGSIMHSLQDRFMPQGSSMATTIGSLTTDLADFVTDVIEGSPSAVGEAAPASSNVVYRRSNQRRRVGGNGITRGHGRNNQEMEEDDDAFDQLPVFGGSPQPPFYPPPRRHMASSALLYPAINDDALSDSDYSDSDSEDDDNMEDLD